MDHDTEKKTDKGKQKIDNWTDYQKNYFHEFYPENNDVNYSDLEIFRPSVEPPDSLDITQYPSTKHVFPSKRNKNDPCCSKNVDNSIDTPNTSWHEGHHLIILDHDTDIYGGDFGDAENTDSNDSNEFPIPKHNWKRHRDHRRHKQKNYGTILNVNSDPKFPRRGAHHRRIDHEGMHHEQMHHEETHHEIPPEMSWFHSESQTPSSIWHQNLRDHHKKSSKWETHIINGETTQSANINDWRMDTCNMFKARLLNMNVKEMEECLVTSSIMGIIRNVEILLPYIIAENSTNSINLAFDQAAKYGHIKIMELLLSFGANPNYGNGKIIGRAVRMNEVEVAEFLLKNGVDVHTYNDRLAIECCSSGDNSELLKILIRNGIDINRHYKELYVNCLDKPKCFELLVGYHTKNSQTVEPLKNKKTDIFTFDTPHIQMDSEFEQNYTQIDSKTNIFHIPETDFSELNALNGFDESDLIDITAFSTDSNNTSCDNSDNSENYDYSENYDSVSDPSSDSTSDPISDPSPSSTLDPASDPTSDATSNDKSLAKFVIDQDACIPKIYIR